MKVNRKKSTRGRLTYKERQKNTHTLAKCVQKPTSIYIYVYRYYICLY